MLKFTGWTIRYVETRGLLERQGVVYMPEGRHNPEEGDYPTAPHDVGLTDEAFFERIGSEVFFDRKEAVEATRKALKHRLTTLGERRRLVLRRLDTLK